MKILTESFNSKIYTDVGIVFVNIFERPFLLHLNLHFQTVYMNKLKVKTGYTNLVKKNVSMKSLSRVNLKIE